MLSKVLFGVVVFAGIALLIVGNLLLDAKEENGTLIQGVETAKGVNERQALTLAEVQKNRDSLMVQMAKDRAKAEQATEDLEISRKGLIQAEADFDQRMKVALEELSDEDLECGGMFVPEPLISGLHDNAASGPD